MKIVIDFGGGWSSRSLVLDGEHAGVAALLLANGRLYESDGDTPDGKHYKLDRKADLSITYATEAQFDELPETVREARKQAEEANSARWKEHSRANDLQKQLELVTAQLQTLQERVTCTASPEPEVELQDEEE
jgi:hypothetical protein